MPVEAVTPNHMVYDEENNTVTTMVSSDSDNENLSTTGLSPNDDVPKVNSLSTDQTQPSENSSRDCFLKLLKLLFMILFLVAVALCGTLLYAGMLFGLTSGLIGITKVVTEGGIKDQDGYAIFFFWLIFNITIAAYSPLIVIICKLLKPIIAMSSNLENLTADFFVIFWNIMKLYGILTWAGTLYSSTLICVQTFAYMLKDGFCDVFVPLLSLGIFLPTTILLAYPVVKIVYILLKPISKTEKVKEIHVLLESYYNIILSNTK